MLLLSAVDGSSQTIDTLANWDGINVNWTVVGGEAEIVENPDQSGINQSANCLEFTTSNSQYDLIFTDFASPVNFTEFPVYRLKILAPETGGSILLKFENSDNTSWEEIEITPAPGEWDDLEFDFSGTTADDYARMVVFFDFLGTTPGNPWYIDDILRVSDGAAGLTSNLPILVINTFVEPIPDEPKITGLMNIIDNGEGNMNNQYDPPNGYNGYVGIEIRGQSAQMFPKKSYGFETRDETGANLNVSLLGMPEENDWILYAPYTDKSMLRNFISYYMGSKLDPYCTRMAYCEVIVNDDYKGVYILMEKIKKDENRVNIATLNPEDISGDELTGGYIVKVDKIDPDFNMGEDGWLSVPDPPYPNAMNIIFQYFYPKVEDIVQQQRDYIHDYITSAENTLSGYYFSNPHLGYNKYLNTGSFVDHMLLREVSKEVDSYRYSTYFFKEKDSDGGKLHAGPPWDFNLGYSNVDYWYPGIDYTGWVYTLVEPVDWSIMFWWARLNDDIYFRNLAKTRWQQMRQVDWSNSQLEYAIDSIVGYIYQAQQRNYERWPILGEYVWPNYNWQGNDYGDEVEFFETWLYNRLDWIDNNLEGNILDPSAELSGTLPEVVITLSDDYFSREILKNKYFVLNNVPPGISIDTVIFENAAQATIHLEGTITYPLEFSVTMDKKILNSFNDLTSGLFSAAVGNASHAVEDPLMFATAGALHLKCNQPELLGGFMDVFNLSGQRISRNAIEQVKLNTIQSNLIPGIYLCSYQYDGKVQTRRIIVPK